MLAIYLSKGLEQYEGPVVVYIASRFLKATIDGSRGLDVVSLILGQPCDAVQPLPKAEPVLVRVLQPVVLVHFPLFQDNSIFNTHCALMKENLGEEKSKEEPTVEVHEFRIGSKASLKGIMFAPWTKCAGRAFAELRHVGSPLS